MSFQAAAIYVSAVTGVYLGAIAQRVDGLYQRYGSREEGQGMVEYAIIGAVVAIAALAAVQAFGQGIAAVFTNLLGKVQGLGR